MVIKIIKRDGREVPFNIEKIADAIFKAAQAVGGQNYDISLKLAEKVVLELEKNHKEKIPSVENIQDLVEKVLIEEGHAKTAKEYILYRAERNKFRQMDTRLMRKFEDIFISRKKEYEGNSNKVILEYATESTKEFHDLYFLNKEHIESHRSGDIYIHDLEYLAIMTNSIQMDLRKKMADGFIDENRNILGEGILDMGKKLFMSLEESQQDQFGYQSIPNFDELMKVGIKNTFKIKYRENFKLACKLILEDVNLEENIENIFRILEDDYEISPRIENRNYLLEEKKYFKELMEDEKLIDKIQVFANREALGETKKESYQSMKNFIYDLNNIRCNRGGRLLDVSINYGTDYSLEARMLVENLIKATRDLAIEGYSFDLPVQIFKVKEGVSLLKEDINRDLLESFIDLNQYSRSLKYSILDTSFNKKYYNKNLIDSEVAYDGNNIRLYGNVFNKKCRSSFNRGNLSVTSLNLPRVVLESDNEADFFKRLDLKINLVIAQLLERFEMQGSKIFNNYPFLMGENIWIESNGLSKYDSIREVLKNGSLSLGFLGLAEALDLMVDKFSLVDKSKDDLGLAIVEHMKERVEDISIQYKMNFNLYGTESKTIGRYFLDKDIERFGLIKGLENMEAYSDSFYFDEKNNMDKIRSESAYHKLVDGGHNFNLVLDFSDVEKIIQLIFILKEYEIGLFNIEINKNS